MSGIKNHGFITNCENVNLVGEYGEDISEMMQMPFLKDVTFGVISKEFLSEIQEMLGYETKKSLKEDWAVSCHSGYFHGAPVFIVNHSRIEYVFDISGDFERLNYDQAEERRNVIEKLADKLDENPEYDSAKTEKEVFKALSNFYRDNKEEMLKHRVMIASFFAYNAGLLSCGTKLSDVAKKVDKKFYLNDINPVVGNELSL